VKITGAKKRFGSCSSQNGLCFSWRLMGYPEEAIDYVVVHELAHIAHRNHGSGFYSLVASVLPDYKARRALLKN
jgi:predicted metal-dependent hydrolase